MNINGKNFTDTRRFMIDLVNRIDKFESYKLNILYNFDEYLENFNEIYKDKTSRDILIKIFGEDEVSKLYKILKQDSSITPIAGARVRVAKRKENEIIMNDQASKQVSNEVQKEKEKQVQKNKFVEYYKKNYTKGIASLQDYVVDFLINNNFIKIENSEVQFTFNHSDMKKLCKRQFELIKKLHEHYYLDKQGIKIEKIKEFVDVLKRYKNDLTNAIKRKKNELNNINNDMKKKREINEKIQKTTKYKTDVTEYIYNLEKKIKEQNKNYVQKIKEQKKNYVLGNIVAFSIIIMVALIFSKGINLFRLGINSNSDVDINEQVSNHIVKVETSKNFSALRKCFTSNFDYDMNAEQSKFESSKKHFELDLDLDFDVHNEKHQQEQKQKQCEKINKSTNGLSVKDIETFIRDVNIKLEEQKDCNGEVVYIVETDKSMIEKEIKDMITNSFKTIGKYNILYFGSIINDIYTGYLTGEERYNRRQIVDECFAETKRVEKKICEALFGDENSPVRKLWSEKYGNIYSDNLLYLDPNFDTSTIIKK